MAKTEIKREKPEIAEHSLQTFVRWVRLRAHHEVAALVDEEETLAQVALLVERVLDGNRNPLSKRGGGSLIPTSCGFASITCFVLFPSPAILRYRYLYIRRMAAVSIWLATS